MIGLESSVQACMYTVGRHHAWRTVSKRCMPRGAGGVVVDVADITGRNADGSEYVESMSMYAAAYRLLYSEPSERSRLEEVRRMAEPSAHVQVVDQARLTRDPSTRWQAVGRGQLQSSGLRGQKRPRKWTGPAAKMAARARALAARGPRRHGSPSRFLGASLPGTTSRGSISTT